MENVKSLRFYSHLFLVPKPQQRFRPVINLSRPSTFLLVERFKMETPESIRASWIPWEWVSLIDLADTYLHIPIHPNSRKYLRFCHRLQMFQFTSLPFRLATAPQLFTMILKEVKLMAQTSPVPGRLVDQGPLSARSTSKHINSGGSKTVLRVDNKSGEVRTKAKSGIFLRGLRIPSRFSPCKTHSREMAQTSGFDPMTQVKTCFDCKMFDVTNWVACLNRENGPGGTPSLEALSVSPQGALEISSVIGHPPSLDRNHFSTPRLVAKSHKRHERRRPSSQDHSIQLFTDASNEGWGTHLEQTSAKALWSDREKRLHINVLELKAVSLALQSFKDQRQNQKVLVATDNSTVVAYINKQGGTHSAEMCTLRWKIMTWCHRYQITLKARHIPGCLNVMADLLSRSNQVQSTEWSLHLQVFKQICLKWFTPHVDLFATRLNHKVPLYVSPVQDQNACDIDALNINWSGLTAYADPPMALLHRVIQKVRQSNCLIIVIAPGWPGMPWFWTKCSSQQRSHFNFQCQELFSNSPPIMCSTAIHSISTSRPGV